MGLKVAKEFKGLKFRADNDPRAAAIIILSEVIYGTEDSQAVLDKYLSSSALVPSDKGLCTELVYGTLRLHLRLEFFIKQKLAKPEKLPIEMLLMLEMSLYTMAYTRIPDHAGLNWATNLTKNRFGLGLSKVTNGVLRNIQRNLKTEYFNPQFYAQALNLKAVGASENEYPHELLSVLYAVPVWIVDLWVKAYGKDKSIAYLKAASKLAPLGVRVNQSFKSTYKNLQHTLLAEEEAFLIAPALVVLPKTVKQPLKLLQQEGSISVQSGAAYEALWALEPHKWQEPIWDACSGRGGKSFALIEQGIKVALASDSSEKRLSGLSKEAERLNLAEFTPKTQVATAEAVAASLKAQNKEMAVVLLDVPCSGLGTLAHRPEIRWRRNKEDIERLCASQKSILESAYGVTCKGGLIAYLTCTLNPQENEEQIADFCANHQNVELVKSWQSSPESLLGEFFWAALIKVN